MSLGRIPGPAAFLSFVLFAVGAATVLAGFNGLSAGTMPRNAAWIALGVGIGVMVLGVGVAWAAERALRREEKRNPPSASSAEDRPNRKRPRPSGPADQLLAKWTLSDEEWREYTKADAREKLRDVPQHAVMGLLAGGVGYWVITGGWGLAAASALAVGATVLGANLVWLVMQRNRAPREGAIVIIRRGMVRIDREGTAIADDGNGPWAVRMRDDLPFPVIEVTTTKTEDERLKRPPRAGRVLRVPVPRGHEAEARRVADQLSLDIRDEAQD
jgi:hypothetical protein